jgi:predicted kinase
MIIIMAGLPGTGKSSIAQALGERLPAYVLDKDRVRHALFAPRRVEYSSTQDDLVVGLMLEAAGYLLHTEPNEPIILDGRTFGRRYQIEQVAAAARELSVPLRVIECVCSDETARTRLTRDVAQGAHLAANRSWELYVAVKARWEPIVLPKLVVDTDAPLEVCVAQCLAYLRPMADPLTGML